MTNAERFTIPHRIEVLDFCVCRNHQSKNTIYCQSIPNSTCSYDKPLGHNLDDGVCVCCVMMVYSHCSIELIIRNPNSPVRIDHSAHDRRIVCADLYYWLKQGDIALLMISCKLFVFDVCFILRYSKKIVVESNGDDFDRVVWIVSGSVMVCMYYDGLMHLMWFWPIPQHESYLFLCIGESAVEMLLGYDCCCALSM